MKNLLKWIGIAFGGLVGLLVLASVVLYVIGSARLNKTHEIQLENIAILTSESAITRGQHLVEVLTFCQACHGDNLEGEVFIDESIIATVYAPNLTSGQGGVGAIYTDADYVGAIRHGVNPEARGLMIMHSDVFHNLSQEDLGAVIAYTKSLVISVFSLGLEAFISVDLLQKMEESRKEFKDSPPDSRIRNEF